MTGIRLIPVTPLGHSADCRICAAVDRWASRRRPSGKQLAAMPDSDFAAFIDDSGIGTVSRPLRASAGRIATDGGAPASASAGSVRPADSRERIPGLRRSG